MPNTTTNFSFNKPLVNDATDEDLWGGYLNTNWDSLDAILPVYAASKYGALVVQSTDDAGYEILSSQGTSGQFLQSNGADALPSFEDVTSISQANQAAIEAQTDEDTYIPPDLLIYHPGIPKVCVVFDGTGTPAVTYGTGVSSITDNGTGNYTLNFSTNFSGTDYIVQLSIEPTTGNDTNINGVVARGSRTVGSVGIQTGTVSGAALDLDNIYVTIWGDWA